MGWWLGRTFWRPPVVVIPACFEATDGGHGSLAAGAGGNADRSGFVFGDGADE